MRTTITQIKEMKAKGEKIPMLTCYDYSTARILDEAGVPMILVGDSLGMVMLGYDSTIPVTIEEMLHHTKAVTRGVKNALVIGDMPFMTYQTGHVDAMKNAGRFLQEAGAQAVKLEGGEHMANTVRHLVEIGIPVQGHLGLTPQSINQLGGYRVQGRSAAAARKLLDDALCLEQAGAFSIVLESVPTPLAKLITEKLSIPTIGIGAGPYCDGQVQVIHDMLGLFPDFVPRHAKQYLRLGDLIREAVTEYNREVRDGAFPTAKESHTMDERLLEELT
ncbi:MAG: 3-methyl-2-oxobutanoate hydroxymethyltransferase [Dehalococcoidia bacterium]|nr:3-methyl-2-oxobutanoate hydroxymethyltransferase [Dehalococcoidia bacterium]